MLKRCKHSPRRSVRESSLHLGLGTPDNTVSVESEQHPQLRAAAAVVGRGTGERGQGRNLCAPACACGMCAVMLVI